MPLKNTTGKKKQRIKLRNRGENYILGPMITDLLEPSSPRKQKNQEIFSARGGGGGEIPPKTFKMPPPPIVPMVPRDIS